MVPTTKATTKERRGTPSVTQNRHICEIRNLAWAATKNSRLPRCVAFLRISQCGFALAFPTVEHKPCGTLRLARGISVPFARRDNRAFHQHMPRLRKCLGFSQVCFLGQATHDSADLCKMDGCGLADGAVHL